MAARARRTATRSGGEIVVVNAAPVARRSGGGGGRRRRRAGGAIQKRRRGRVGGSGGGAKKSIMNVALGGLAFGLLVKNWAGMPTVPGVGRSGTVALAVYLLNPSNKILQDMGVAAAAIAGYTFGNTGTVAGAGDEDEILASQG